MSRKIEFFFDYISVYSYLANSQLGQFNKLEIVFRPMLLGAVMQATGNRPPATVAAKGVYLTQDVERWAHRYSLPLNWNPKFPQNTVNALRIALLAQREDVFETIHQLLFDAMWVERADLSDKATLSSLVEQAGLSANDYMQAIGQDDIKEELKRNTAEAVERGAFGAPTWFVGDDMFFGNDRFEFIMEAAAG